MSLTKVTYAMIKGATANVLDYGAVGDGVADDTVAIQAAIDSGADVVTFPAGTYLATTIKLHAGQTLLGYGAIIKQPVVPNFTRLFDTNDTRTGKAPYTGAVDSAPLIIKGFTLDGQRSIQGPYVGYEKEQNQLLFLYASPATAGRLRVIVSDCVFQNSTSDGISVYKQTNVKISDCYFYDCFRGSITNSGGGAIWSAVNCYGSSSGNNDTYLHIEVDSTGYDGTMTCVIDVANLNMPGFSATTDYNVGNAHDWKFANCTFGKVTFNVNMSNGGTLLCSNCTFEINANSSRRIYRYGQTRFVGCNFKWVDGAINTAFIQPGGTSTIYSNQIVEFDTCTFDTDNSYHTTAPVAISTATLAGTILTLDFSAAHGLLANDYVKLTGFSPAGYNGVWLVRTAPTGTQITIRVPTSLGAVTISSATGAKRDSSINAVYVTADDNDYNNRVIVNGGKISSVFNVGVTLLQGGNLEVNNVYVDSPVPFSITTASTRGFTVTIGNIKFGPNVRAYAQIGASVNNANVITHNNLVISDNINLINTVSNLNFLTMYGARYIYGAAAPTSSDASLRGDEWRLLTPVAATAYSYIATSNIISGGTAVWKTATTLSA